MTRGTRFPFVNSRKRGRGPSRSTVSLGEQVYTRWVKELLAVEAEPPPHYHDWANSILSWVQPYVHQWTQPHRSAATELPAPLRKVEELMTEWKSCFLDARNEEERVNDCHTYIQALAQLTTTPRLPTLAELFVEEAKTFLRDRPWREYVFRPLEHWRDASDLHPVVDEHSPVSRWSFTDNAFHIALLRTDGLNKSQIRQFHQVVERLTVLLNSILRNEQGLDTIHWALLEPISAHGRRFSVRK